MAGAACAALRCAGLRSAPAAGELMGVVGTSASGHRQIGESMALYPGRRLALARMIFPQGGN
jgi:hypothetical protein